MDERVAQKFTPFTPTERNALLLKTTKVDIFTMLFTKSVVLYFEHTSITFSGNFRDDQNRKACLRSFLNKGCLLTEAALTVAGILKK